MKKKVWNYLLAGVAVTFAFALNTPLAQAAAVAKPEPRGSNGGWQQQSAGEYFDDTVITTAVKAKVLGEKGLSSLDISIKTEDGIVTLSGKVDTAEHSRLAGRTVKQVKGVRQVVNNLQVGGETSQSIGEYFDDSVITTGVKTKILGEKGLSSLDINVKTKDGIVTLSGKVDTAEHSRLATRTADKVKGVRQVINLLKED